MKTLEGCQWRRSSVFIVNCEHISNFALIVDFEQANARWIHIEKTNTFKDKIGHIICYVVVFCSILNMNKIYYQIAFELTPL